MTAPNTIQLSQGLEVLPPKPYKAYAIACKEWDVIRTRVSKMSDEPFLFQSVGSAGIGAGVATITAILTDSVVGSNPADALTKMWAVGIVLLIAGGLALIFAVKERKVRRERADEIVENMKLIEERYDKSAV